MHYRLRSLYSQRLYLFFRFSILFFCGPELGYSVVERRLCFHAPESLRLTPPPPPGQNYLILRTSTEDGSIDNQSVYLTKNSKTKYPCFLFSFFHSFIGCPSCDIQYKFIIRHTKKKKKRKEKKKKQKSKMGRCNGTNVPCEATPPYTSITFLMASLRFVAAQPSPPFSFSWALMLGYIPRQTAQNEKSFETLFY